MPKLTKQVASNVSLQALPTDNPDIFIDNRLKRGVMDEFRKMSSEYLAELKAEYPDMDFNDRDSIEEYGKVAGEDEVQKMEARAKSFVSAQILFLFDNEVLITEQGEPYTVDDENRDNVLELFEVENYPQSLLETFKELVTNQRKKSER